MRYQITNKTCGKFSDCGQLGLQMIHSDLGKETQHLPSGLCLVRLQHQRPHLPRVSDRHVRHKFNTAGDANIVDTFQEQSQPGQRSIVILIYLKLPLTHLNESKASGDRLVRRYASHGDCVRRDSVREARPEGRLSCNVARLHLLDHCAHAEVVDQALVYARLVDQPCERVPLQVVWHEALVVGAGGEEWGADAID